MLLALEHEHARALAHDEAVAVGVERARHALARQRAHALEGGEHRPVSAASVPPATTTSASPRTIIRVASPIAWAPVAHALETLKPGPWAPSRIAITPAAALGIIIGTKSGETARSPPSSHASHSFCSVFSPPTPVPMSTPRRSGSTPSGSPASSAACMAAATASCVKRSAAARLLGRHGDLGVEVDARADAVGDARALAQQGVEERVGALADRRDDARVR